MLILCGDVAWSSSGRRLAQAMGRDGIGIEEMLQNVTRATIRVAHARSAATQAIAALEAAINPASPGPSLLVVPLDCSAPPAESARVKRARASVHEQLADDVVIEVAKKLANARRPLLVIGAGCLPYADVLKHLVETLGIPFTTTPRAKGVVSERHRCSLRN